MIFKPYCIATMGVVLSLPLLAPALAQTPQRSGSPSASTASAPNSGNATGPQAFDAWVKDAEVGNGLISIAKKNNAYYFLLEKRQLDSDFIETSVPSSGLGGLGPNAGDAYVAPSRIMRFERVGDRVVLQWRNSYTLTSPGTAEEAAAKQGFPSSVIGIVEIAAEDKTSGKIAVPMSTFLADVADYVSNFQGESNPMRGYTLDPQRTYFVEAKAFPQNDVLHVSQTWQNPEPHSGDNAPDARSLQVAMTYNLVAPPNDGYVPRYYDSRVGYFTQALLNFANDRQETRGTFYITRWNFAPASAGTPSAATHPLIYYISDDVPKQYRDTIKRALLSWNEAFQRIGILNAIQVEQQPDDPSWDPEDIRYNLVRWVDSTTIQYSAAAMIITDPRTGEEINAGVDIDAVIGLSRNAYKFVVAPARGLPDSDELENRYEQDYLRSIVLHESGHDMGLQHNFIASMAYTAKELQDPKFTARMGTTASVMEYSGLNIWPRGTGQGSYHQLVLGPYDYYAIRYGYGYIADATTAQQELPTLRKWASLWSNPLYRFASDEDTDFESGHAIDPRVQENDLTDSPIDWCVGQMHLMHVLMNSVSQHFPRSGESFDEARRAFVSPLGIYLFCATMPAHAIGGEYLSRSRPGDPGAKPPLQAIPRSAESRAWNLLSTGLFSNEAWQFNPSVLTRLTYTEVSPLNSFSWAYVPRARYDIPIATVAERAQDQVISELFAPVRLQRIADLVLKYPAGATMSLSDLFDWAQDSIFGDVARGAASQDGLVRRNLQIRYAKQLAQLWVKPAAGTPPDAQALGRLQLLRLVNDAMSALNRGELDELTRAHLEALEAIAKQALDARATISSGDA